MRKQLVALLSLLGLAGPATPGSAQVLKGSQPADTKSESTLKTSKAAQENAAMKSSAGNKAHKARIYADAGSKDAAKMTKARQENAAVSDVVTEKRNKTTVHPDALTVKQKTGISSGSKARPALGDGSVHMSKTGKKTTATDDWEATGSAKSGHKKPAGDDWESTQAAKVSRKNAAEKSAAQQNANQKAVKQAGQPH